MEVKIMNSSILSECRLRYLLVVSVWAQYNLILNCTNFRMIKYVCISSYSLFISLPGVLVSRWHPRRLCIVSK